MGKFDFIDEEIARLREAGLYNTIRTIESPQGAWITVDGKKVLNMCSNNYLGFANEKRLAESAKQHIDRYGVGPGAVRSIAGTMAVHLELEKKLATFKAVEETLSLQSGFVANQAVIPSIVPGEDDAVFTDSLNHASIIDGVRLTKAQRFIYQHNEPEDLEKKLREAAGIKKKLIITDGVFSMDGDIAPLPEICNIADRYEAMVMVDDAHGEGVLGRNGRGIADHFGLHGRIDFEVGTLSKAFGVVGGFVSGKAKVIEFLRQKARTFLFSSAVTPADAGASIAAVDILMESEERVKRLWDNTAFFKDKMKGLGFDLGISRTPITPVMLGEAKVAQAFSRKLFEKGIFAMAIGFPTVAKGKARIRVMLSATHSTEDLEKALGVFEAVGRELHII
ncbi:MAG: glycine C-acetyltransferase [Candidatus Eremiobacteraeota bacterium]|nr:glycine C-acetyltransferase [Candidatus Eremiobacteraeota bacterium]